MPRRKTIARYDTALEAEGIESFIGNAHVTSIVHSLMKRAAYGAMLGSSELFSR
jgi:hypothetical protein